MGILGVKCFQLMKWGFKVFVCCWVEWGLMGSGCCLVVCCSMLLCIYRYTSLTVSYLFMLGVLFSGAFVCGLKVACSRAVHGTQSYS